MIATATPETTFAPRAPHTLDELDLPVGVVHDIFLRRLYRDGIGSLSSLSAALRLEIPIIESVFHDFRQRMIVEVKGMEGDDFRFSLTEAGHRVAEDRLRVSEYAGAAPVSLAEYFAGTKAQFAKVEIDRDELRQRMSDVVLTDETLDTVGPALISQDSLFLYGPTGNGKTTLAERLLRVYGDQAYVPYAVEVDSQIIVLHDPTVHIAVDNPDPLADPRWKAVKRPCVTVGGELVSEMLDLRRDSDSGVYVAPLQMKANNGMLIIDDFGRQAISPERLLNRWIVPLDRRVDYLTLQYGLKFEIPFELMVVFSTNLNPQELADEAFLRRIRNKVYLGPVAPKVFDQIFLRMAKQRGLDAGKQQSRELQELCKELGPGELRACYPRDMFDILIAASTYRKTTPVVNRDELERAAKIYFTKRLSHDGYTGARTR